VKGPKYIPLEESNVPFQRLARTMCTIHLPTLRKVMVGRLEGNEQGVVIRLESPDPGTDRIAVLEFGLKQDAAEALYNLLRHELA
jgi:hypothetical protein